MDGRWLPWREQKKDIRPHPDYHKELQKPLKAPPRGLEWRRLEDGSWELRTIKPKPGDDDANAIDGVAGAPGDDAENGTPGAPEFLEHAVTPEDTLTGICMRYKVKAQEIRQLNGFVGEHFRLCHTLIVPNKLVAHGKSIQPPSRDVILQRFRHVSNLGEAEARYYLGETHYDLERALSLWRVEKSWEASQAFQARNNQAITGTINSSGYRVTDNGSIEMCEPEEYLADARVPLLSNRRATRFNLKATRR